ncbi:MAG: hypothetical protein IKE60_02405 [Reyranella sp.]|uniref:hypothetical protein n=1 Tax=Reyranella sp. TaxID=1929291 RepID=UPI0025F82213|nr:hypothetical protein [Reyranella sp.]MBR2813474.1 hypothetical protein [Reyranella sp.]
MSERKWFVPTEGMSIIDPATRQVVPPEGKWVFASDEFFLRRELDGGGKLSDTPPPGAEADV